MSCFITILLSKIAFHDLKFGSQVWAPEMICWIGRGVVVPQLSAWITTCESPSTMTYLSPSSYAKMIPHSIALASASISPSGYESIFESAPMSCPLSLRITTPRPHCPASTNTVASTFILYQSGGGGFQNLGEVMACLGVGWLATFRYSVMYRWASLMILEAVFEVAPYLILFLLFQMPHAVVMRISMSTWEWFSWNSQSISMKSRGSPDWLGGWILRVVHTSLAKLHFHKTCPVVSTFSHRS